LPYLNVPFSREYIDVLDLYLHRSLTGELEPEEALKRAGEEWHNIGEGRVREATGNIESCIQDMEGGRISIGQNVSYRIKVYRLFSACHV